ncbi:ABC transporter permease subunit [Aquisalimonas lutea]|uniref:ABC transporter permease n=1 Tax=Aquisalimonas lutea TaxID=1327750 RepID=UPI0025B54302|nr:ABC transporter permease subunit [Aquisalimonas lutea]MDN3519466.1 ABC transporter permease subunit [Aquisalimonas lutea]
MHAGLSGLARLPRSLLGSAGGLAGLCALLALWELASARYGDLLLPSPRAAFGALQGLWQSGAAAEAALATARRALVGFALAALTGVTLGLLAGRLRLAARLCDPLATVLLGVPPIAWVVLAILWFQGGLLTPVFTVVATTLPVTFAAAQSGARTVDPRLEEMADAFRFNAWRRLTWLYLPHLLSYLFPAFITTLGVAWKVTVMTELLALGDGIGAELASARASLDTRETLAWVCLVVTVLLALEHGLLRPLQRRVEQWRET